MKKGDRSGAALPRLKKPSRSCLYINTTIVTAEMKPISCSELSYVVIDVHASYDNKGGFVQKKSRVKRNNGQVTFGVLHEGYPL